MIKKFNDFQKIKEGYYRYLDGSMETEEERRKRKEEFEEWCEELERDISSGKRDIFGDIIEEESTDEENELNEE